MFAINTLPEVRIKVKYFPFFCCLCFQLLMLNCDFRTGTEEETVRLKFLPVFNFVSIDIPEALVNSPDPMAQTTVTLLNFHNSMNQYVEFLNFPFHSINAGPPWEKELQIEQDMFTKLLLFNEQDEELFVWNILKTGYDSLTGQKFDNWLILSAEYNPASGSKKNVVYDENSAWYKIRVTFNFTGQGGITCFYRTSISDFFGHFALECAKTSEFIVDNFLAIGHLYYSDSLDIDIYWDINGNGYWNSRDDGNLVVDSGTW